MGTVVGTNGDDERLEDMPFDVDAKEADVIFGLRGDDGLFGGFGQDSLFGGPGDDTLTGGRQIDFYHFIQGGGDDVINEFENTRDVNGGTAQNNADRLRFWTPDTDHTDEAFLDLEYVSDAFLVLQGETLNSPMPVSNRIEYGAFFYARGASLQIEDQYGNNDGNTPQDPNDTHDGIEFIHLDYLNFLGNRTERQFEFNENQSEIEARIQRGDGLDDEFFLGSRGADSIFGNSGQDLIFTGAGDDSAFGGSGIDHIHASRGKNFLNGGSSNDYYYWNRDFRARNTIQEEDSSDNDLLAADFGIGDLNRAVATSPTGDLVLGFAKAADLSNELSSFRLSRQFSTDLMIEDYDIEHIRFEGVVYDLQQDFSESGSSAADFIAMTAQGSNTIRAGESGDVVFANRGRDNVKGQAGDDFIDGGGGKDRVMGGGGDDMLRGGRGGDVIVGGAGTDTADYRNSANAVNVNLSNVRQKSGEAGGDKLRGIENVIGSENGDKLRGDGDANEIRGRLGSDLIRGGGGRDDLVGNSGGDRAYGGGGRDDIWGGGGRDKLWGDNGRDRIWTDAGPDRAWGGGGDDRIWGGNGRDKLWGNRGDDTFYGSGGRDTYYVGPGDDRIVRYDSDRDKIAFSGPDKPGGMRDLDISSRGSDVLVRWDGGSVRIEDVNRNEIDRSDFDF